MKDISTVAGILAGFALIIFAMVFSTDPIGINIGAVKNFVDPASIFIVIGGVFASVFASYPISTLKKMPKHLKIVVSGNRYQYAGGIFSDCEKERPSGAGRKGKPAGGPVFQAEHYANC